MNVGVVIMAQVIVFTSGKGGVGKTTLCANVGFCLASLGKRVLLVDTDTGLRDLDVLLGVGDKVVYDLCDVIYDKCEPSEALVSYGGATSDEGLFLLSASQTKTQEDIPDDGIKRVCNLFSDKFDYILLDCPAGIERGFKNVITAADIVIIVATPDIVSIRDAEKAVYEAERLSDAACYLAINKFSPSLAKEGAAASIENVVDFLNIDLIGVVPSDDEVIACNNKGYPFASKNDCFAAKGVENLSRRITGETVQLMDFEKKRGFFKKLFGK